MDDYSINLLTTPLFCGLSSGISILGGSYSTCGLSVIIQSFQFWFMGLKALSTVNQAIQRFCFYNIYSLFAVVQNSISPATAIRLGRRVLKIIFFFNSLLFSSFMLLSRVSNCCLYSRVTQNLSFLFNILTISRSISKASLRQTSQQFLSYISCSAAERSSLGRSLISQNPQQRQKNSFSLHSKRNLCILVSQIEGRYMLLYCLQQSYILFLIRFDFQLRITTRSLGTSFTFFYSVDGFLIFCIWIILCLFLIDQALLSYIYSLNLYYLYSCSLQILKTYS